MEVQYWKLAQTAALFSLPTGARAMRPNAFNSTRVLLDDTAWFRFQPFSSDRAAPRNREIEKRSEAVTDWTPPWFMSNHVPRVHWQQLTGAGHRTTASIANPVICRPSTPTSLPFSRSTRKPFPVQRFSKTLHVLCCVLRNGSPGTAAQACMLHYVML
jgi:hypothetical protein